MKLGRLIGVGVIGFGVAAGAAAAETGTLPLQISPEQIEMGMLYSGGRVRVSGTIEAGSQVVVVARGPEHEEAFNKKVRAGPIWISSGQVHVSGVPSLFLSFASAPVRTLLREEVVDREVLDVAAIRRHMVVDAGDDPVDRDVMTENYVSLKTERETYQVHEDAVELGAAMDAGVPFSLEFEWPRIAQPQVYSFSAYECRDGQIVRRGGAELNVVKVGMPESIHAFAMNQSVQYGILAVLIAVIAGFGIDFVTTKLFGAKPRGGH